METRADCSEHTILEGQESNNDSVVYSSKIQTATSRSLTRQNGAEIAAAS